MAIVRRHRRRGYGPVQSVPPRLLRPSPDPGRVQGALPVEPLLHADQRIIGRCHAFRLHANAAITMYAPLDSNVFDGARNARTPFLSCSIRFSWLPRSFAKYTISDRSQVHWLVM